MSYSHKLDLSKYSSMPTWSIDATLQDAYKSVSEQMENIYYQFSAQRNAPHRHAATEEEGAALLPVNVTASVEEIIAIIKQHPKLLSVVLNEAIKKQFFGLAEIDPEKLKETNRALKAYEKIPQNDPYLAGEKTVAKTNLNSAINDVLQVLNFTAEKPPYPVVKDCFNKFVIALSIPASINGALGGFQFVNLWGATSTTEKYTFMAAAWSALALNFMAAKAPANASALGYIFAGIFAVSSAFISWDSAEALPAEFGHEDVKSLTKILIAVLTVIPNFICNVGLDGLSLNELINSLRLLQGMWNAASLKGRIWLMTSRLGLLLCSVLTLTAYYIGSFKFLTTKIPAIANNHSDASVMGSATASLILSLLSNLGMLSMLFNLSFRGNALINHLTTLAFYPEIFKKVEYLKTLGSNIMSVDTVGRLFFGMGGASAFLGLNAKIISNSLAFHYCHTHTAGPSANFPANLDYPTLCPEFINWDETSPATVLINYCEYTTGYSFIEILELVSPSVRSILWFSLVIISLVSFSNYERLWFSLKHYLQWIASCGCLPCKKQSITLINDYSKSPPNSNEIV